MEHEFKLKHAKIYVEIYENIVHIGRLSMAYLRLIHSEIFK